MKAWFLCVTVLVGFLFSNSIFADRTEDRLGVIVTRNDPMPGGIGGGLSLNATRWMRFNALMGFDEIVENETESGGVADDVAAAVFWIILLGQVEYDEIKDFLAESTVDNTAPVIKRKITTQSLGLELLHPDWRISPMLGVGYSSYKVDNNYKDLGTDNQSVRKNTVFYKLGVDWQGESGLSLAVGAAYAPDLPEPLQWKAFGKMGYYFF